MSVAKSAVRPEPLVNRINVFNLTLINVSLFKPDMSECIPEEDEATLVQSAACIVQ
jgi:hypothetical protein